MKIEKVEISNGLNSLNWEYNNICIIYVDDLSFENKIREYIKSNKTIKRILSDCKVNKIEIAKRVNKNTYWTSNLASFGIVVKDTTRVITDNI